MTTEAAHPPRREGFRLRAFITGLSVGAFLALLSSGIVLFIAPSGRVARALDWTFLGVSKGGWEEIHITFTAVFLIAVVVHLVINWIGFRVDAMGRSRRRPRLRMDFLGALVLVALLVVAALADWQPARSMMTLHDYFKETLWNGEVSASGHDNASDAEQVEGRGGGQGLGGGQGRRRLEE